MMLHALCMHQHLSVAVLSSIPIQHISQCIPECLQCLLAFSLIGHNCASPEQHNLDLPWGRFTLHDIACHRTRENMLPVTPYLFQPLSQLLLLAELDLH